MSQGWEKMFRQPSSSNGSCFTFFPLHFSCFFYFFPLGFFPLRPFSRCSLLFAALFFPLIVFSSLHCGVNSSETTLPASPFFPHATAPAIVSVEPIRSGTEWEFELSYYVTNEEPGFLGYNLYISPLSISSSSLIANRGPKPYLERGIPPSFSHFNDRVSTASSDQIRQRLMGRRPPPAAEPFYECQRYYFRLTAYLRGDLESEPSSEIAVCATFDPASCPASTSCSPL